MPEPTARKFTMADLMILIAGCAVGIAWTRSYYQSVFNQFEGMSLDWRFRLPMLMMFPVPILSMISVALLVCRLRPPRPKLRRLLRQPGAVAMACVFLLLAYAGTTRLASRAFRPIFDLIWPHAPMLGGISFDSTELLSMLYAVIAAGMIIAPCWLLLLAVGRWRPEPTWIDRSGRFVGACWIALYVISSLGWQLFI